MAQLNRYPQPVDQILAEGYALPANGTPVILTNTATIDSKKAGNIWVRVFAVNAVEVGSTHYLSFVPMVGATTTAVATWTGGGTRLPSTTISNVSASASSDVDWVAGELICEFCIPKNMVASTDKYLAVYAVVTDNESADQIEAYVFIED